MFYTCYPNLINQVILYKAIALHIFTHLEVESWSYHMTSAIVAQNAIINLTV